MLNIYKNKKVLIFGHTGFKGSWLALWLSRLGANISGISLPPENKYDHFNLLNLDIDTQFLDIRDYEGLKKKLVKFNPDLIFHLAAQPLVRDSYVDPLKTWSTNVIGSANILNAIKYARNLKGIIVVTSDKCYENKEIRRGYKEDDPMGGNDPYSASKGACEILVNSYRKSFFDLKSSPIICSVRAGNVIGGGDWSKDRLIPDIIKSIKSKKILKIRYPHAIRPWQHVLDCIYGYLLLGEKLLKHETGYSGAWNFGPNRSEGLKVIDILTIIKEQWNSFDWEIEKKIQPYESNLLLLNNTKAKTFLKWNPIWRKKISIYESIYWYKEFLKNKKIISEQQLEKYIKLIK